MTDENLPDEYTPKELRPRLHPAAQEHRQVLYAVGMRDGSTHYGMTHGPVPDLQTMLDVVPYSDDGRFCLIRFNRDGTDEVLYRFRKTEKNPTPKWIRERDIS